jgi:hypothetical protein
MSVRNFEVMLDKYNVRKICSLVRSSPQKYAVSRVGLHINAIGK